MSIKKLAGMWTISALLNVFKYIGVVYFPTNKKLPLLSSVLKYGLAAGVVFILSLGIASPGMAQERDTTKSERRLHTRPSLFDMEGHSERSANTLSLPSSGVYEVPEETKYYKPEFKGQYYLDMAVEAYREEQRDKLGLNKLFRFMNMLAPYVYNQFEFGVYQIENLPVVDRDNPLFQSDQ